LEAQVHSHFGLCCAARAPLFPLKIDSNWIDQTNDSCFSRLIQKIARVFVLAANLLLDFWLDERWLLQEFQQL